MIQVTIVTILFLRHWDLRKIHWLKTPIIKMFQISPFKLFGFMNLFAFSSFAISKMFWSSFTYQSWAEIKVLWWRIRVNVFWTRCYQGFRFSKPESLSIKKLQLIENIYRSTSWTTNNFQQNWRNSSKISYRWILVWHWVTIFTCLHSVFCHSAISSLRNKKLPTPTYP